MKMSFRKKRIVLLASVVTLLILSILDISIRKGEGFEAFNEQFLNKQKTDAYVQAHQDVIVTTELQLEINRKDIKEVSLSSIGGKISVKRADDSVIRLEYIVTASALDVDAANRKRDAVKVKEEVKDGRLSLVTQANGRAISRDTVSVDYVLHLPDEMKLVLDNEAGAVRISGITGDVDATSSRGLLEIIDVEGEFTVESSDGSVYLSDITGNIDLKNNHSRVNIDHTKGAILLNTQEGQTLVTNIQGSITGNTEFGHVYLREITGSVELNSRGADIQLDHIRGDSRLVSESGNTTFILPEVEVEGYELDATVSGGKIHTQLPLPNKDDKFGDYESHMNGVVGKGTWKVEVTARSGDIIFQVK
jgi:hypothetical protein